MPQKRAMIPRAIAAALLVAATACVEVVDLHEKGLAPDASPRFDAVNVDGNDPSLPPPSVDAANVDASTDAITPDTDARPPVSDAGPPVSDAGAVDAGLPASDAGAIDATAADTSTDGGAFVPTRYDQATSPATPQR